ncbi:hypothetical protein B296_00015098 [Ensete ventricosum]|uniref:Uncharacterized protein n=1 Tax=Ensete ventricosum TaxID=4639 RepID=A0A426X7Y0_ENSVE|nr:hypothetical protein B296_00015098 [Ensete ventricosum]
MIYDFTIPGLSMLTKSGRDRVDCEGSKEEGKPPVVAAALQARTTVASSQGVVANGQQPGRKGLLPTVRPQGAAAHGYAARGGCPLQGAAPRPGLPLVGAVANRSCGHRQPVRCCPKAAVPVAGAAAHADGVQHRHLRRATAVQMGVRRGLGHPFK